MKVGGSALSCQPPIAHYKLLKLEAWLDSNQHLKV